MDEGGYGRFAALSRQELERYCYLDDKDRALIAARRRDYNRLGFAVQVVTVRNLGMFLADPVDVPAELVQYLAEQLGIDDPGEHIRDNRLPCPQRPGDDTKSIRSLPRCQGFVQQAFVQQAQVCT